MYFHIALRYYATIKVEQHDKQLKNLKEIIIIVPHRLPSHTGSGMLTAKVSQRAVLGRPQLVGLVLAACPTAKNGVAVTRDYQASVS